MYVMYVVKFGNLNLSRSKNMDTHNSGLSSVSQIPTPVLNLTRYDFDSSVHTEVSVGSSDHTIALDHVVSRFVFCYFSVFSVWFLDDGSLVSFVRFWS